MLSRIAKSSVHHYVKTVKIKFGTEGRRAMLAGVDFIDNSVLITTQGPKV